MPIPPSRVSRRALYHRFLLIAIAFWPIFRLTMRWRFRLDAGAAPPFAAGAASRPLHGLLSPGAQCFSLTRNAPPMAAPPRRSLPRAEIFHFGRAILMLMRRQSAYLHAHDFTGQFHK